MRPVFCTIVALLLVTAAAGVLAEDHEAEAREIEGLLMAPCCGANTLAMHESGPAHEMKGEIREMLAAGKSRNEILDHYVAQYGNTILAMPPAKGFNLLVYVLPALALILGPVLAWRRLRGRAVPVPQRKVRSTVLDPAYRERLERELKESLR